MLARLCCVWHKECMETQTGVTQMTSDCKGQNITRNMNSNWVVSWSDGSHTMHRTLAAAKERISFVTVR